MGGVPSAVGTGNGSFSYYVGANNSTTGRALSFALGTALTVSTVQPGTVSNITLATSPAGLSVMVDGAPYPAPHTFQWTTGSSHTLGVSSPQSGGGTQYVFSSWSQGGSQSQTVTAAGDTTDTANFSTQYQLTTSVSPAAAGTVTPASGNYYTPGSSPNVVATAASGYMFSNWTGPVSSPQSASTNIVMNAPQAVTANFVPSITATLATNPAGESFMVDGTTYTAAQTFQWGTGSSHTIGVASPQGSGAPGYVFSFWSNGGAQTQTVAPTANVAYTANFNTQYLVNAGGPAFTDSQGSVWSADIGFSGGSVLTTTSSISGADSPALYHSARQGAFSYQFAVPNGDYLLHLKFAEIQYGQPGNRLFNVTINGNPALMNFDPGTVAGATFTATDQQFPVTVSGNQLAIAFNPVQGEALVNGIEVVPAALRVNAGGPSYTAPGGTVWSADTDFSTACSLSTSSAIAGTTEPELYQTQHCSTAALDFQAPLPDGEYLVRLKFAEIVYAGPGQRVFNVHINGNQVLTGFDPFAAAGAAFTAIDKQFLVSKKGGLLDIHFDAVVGMPAVAAIEVLPGTAVRVNSGGLSYVDQAGNEWSGDYNYSGGTTFHWGHEGQTITGTPDPALYQTERQDPNSFLYQFAVPNGNYTVSLYFADITGTCKPLTQGFNVAINGSGVLTRFNPCNAAGGSLAATVQTFPVTISGGQPMTISFNAGPEAPFVNAIGILSLIP